MNRLIKAEWYRIRHSAGLITWIIVICIILFIMPAMTDIHFYEKTVSQNLIILSDVTTTFGMIFTVVLISICIGISYQNKIAYYEVMHGHDICDILFSKLIVYVSMMMAGVVVPYGIFLMVIAWKNGMGELDKIPLRIILFLIIYMHVCVTAVLLTTSLRHIAAAGVVFLRFELEGLSALIPVIISEFTEIESITANRILEWFVTSQYAKILGGKIDNHIIVSVIFSFLLEFVLWFALSYIGMKKKKYR
ncbi:MAG: hypothetical protein K2M78_03890 [Lachnospiraceae bacterium]|nr:hypothetical protein [Lachnospiraceae bacterium]